MSHVFGKSIDFRFFPIAKDEAISAYSLSSARIYSSYPSEGQISNTLTGHIEEVTTWTNIAENEFEISFAALDDSSPYNNEDYESYYVVINYRLESGGDIVHDVETIHVYRPDSFTDSITTIPEDVYKLERRIKEIIDNDIEEQDYIETAKEEIKSKLQAKGYSLRKIFNWQKLNLACARLACALTCNSLASEGSQFWAQKAGFWQSSFEQMFNAAVVGYDLEGSDTPLATDEIRGGGVCLVR